MDPAYPLPLNEQQLALLGELTSILGQVDEIMVRTVEQLLAINRETANKIMGSSKVSDNADIWAEVIRNRTTDEDIAWLVKHALSEMQTVSTGRNDFIHAWFDHIRKPSRGLFGGSYFGASYFGPSYFGGPRWILSARRIRSSKTRPLGDLGKVRNQAARLSCLVAHIDHMVTDQIGPSAWLGRLALSLPPRPPKDENPRLGKGRRAQRRP